MKKIDVEGLYEMKLHECAEIHNSDMHLKIIRVPGGWLYRYILGETSDTVFVPFDNEFQPAKYSSRNLIPG